jgi:hypothetical protein
VSSSPSSGISTPWCTICQTNECSPRYPLRAHTGSSSYGSPPRGVWGREIIGPRAANATSASEGAFEAASKAQSTLKGESTIGSKLDKEPEPPGERKGRNRRDESPRCSGAISWWHERELLRVASWPVLPLSSMGMVSEREESLPASQILRSAAYCYDNSDVLLGLDVVSLTMRCSYLVLTV